MGQEIQSNTQHAAGDVYQEGDEEVQANDQAVAGVDEGLNSPQRLLLWSFRSRGRGTSRS